MLSAMSGDDSPAIFLRHHALGEADLNKVEDIADEVLNGTLQSSALPLMSGLGVGFGVAAISGVPVIGAIASSYFIYSAIATAKRKGQEAEYIKDSGILAHCLKEPQLVRYAEIVGLQCCVDEIRIAYRDGQPITSGARKLLKATGETVTRRTIDSFMAELKKLDLVPNEERTLLLEASPDSPDSPAPTIPYFNEKTGEGSFVMDAVMKSPGISRLMIGGQRTGKSYLAAVASRELVAQGWKIYHVNLASYGTEDSYYWEHCTRSVVGDLPSITEESEAITLLGQAIECLNDFWAQEKAIMVCDEITYMGSKFGQWDEAVNEYLCLVAGRISALTSSGMKREKAIWALCPELVSGSLVGPAKAIKLLDLMLFAIAPGRSVTWNKQEITFNESLYGQVAHNFENVSRPTEEQVRLCNDHGIDRICYLNGEWLPVGDLPKLEPSAIPDTPAELVRVWGGANPYQVLAHGLANMLIPQETDPAIELIDALPDLAQKEAMGIAYQWALCRRESVGEITKIDFMNRAKNERKSDYLKLNRSQIWDDLQGLIE